MESRSWSCPSCDDVREFVQPTCVDGHVEDGGECPEWACVDCGAALVVGELAVVRAPGRLQHAA